MANKNKETWITITNENKKTDLHIRAEEKYDQHYMIGLSLRGQSKNNQDAVKANSIEDIIQWWLNSPEETLDSGGYVNYPESSELVEVW